MTLNRVVVTGYGSTSPIGNTPEELRSNPHDGKIGVGLIIKLDNPEIPVYNADEIHDFPFDKYSVCKDKNCMDQYSLYAIYAALEALENARLDMDTVDRDRTSVIVPSGIGSLQKMQKQIIRMHEKGIRYIQPMFIPKALPNVAAGNIVLHISVCSVCGSITTAYASFNDTVGEAFREIRFGYHDMISAGGAGLAINGIGTKGFNALTALSTTEDPVHSVISSGKDRNGFVMDEGVGVLVLEGLEHVQKHGATILTEVVGHGSNCDTYHQTTPALNGSDAAEAIKLAIKEAGIPPEDVDYVNTHGTSTQANEEGGSRAIVTVLGKGVLASSTKSLTNHPLGAAGTVEVVATIEVLRYNCIPMTVGTRELSEDIEVNIVYGQGQEAELKYTISNTLGFGGHNAVSTFKRWEA